MAKIYHDKVFNPINIRERVFPNDFLLVAETETEALEEAFRLTNHIDEEWWLNEGVTLFEKSRSTSGGDVIVRKNGDAFAVRTIGWSFIGNIKDQPISFESGFGILEPKDARFF
jgi:hypothetical protein